MVIPGLQWLHLIIVTCVIVSAHILESAVRLFYRLFPFPAVLDAIYERSAGLRRSFAYRLSAAPERHGGVEDARGHTAKAVTYSMTARELILHAGFGVEEHSAVTPDGFVLGLQRVCVHTHGHTHFGLAGAGVAPSDAHSVASSSRHSANGTRGTRERSVSDPLAPHPAPVAASPSGFRPPVLIMHGLMQCSEAWLVGARDAALPYMLADAGFDVWVGNNRGNKYSAKHLRLSPHSDAYWDFCIDDLARYDLPTMVDYILKTTGAAKLAYVGFSQGTAQCFAALSAMPELNDKLSVFVALSPALALRGLAKSPLTALVQSDLSFIYTLFGRRRMLPVTLNMQSVLSGSAWVGLLDACLMYLFRWSARLIDPVFKQEAYHHIYSFASVKTVVHWFQMLGHGRFAMFSDVHGPSLTSMLTLGSSKAIDDHTVPPLYDVSKIKTPMALFAGEADTLIDIPKLLTLLPAYSQAVPMPVRGASGLSAAASSTLGSLFRNVAYTGHDSTAGVALDPHRLVLPAHAEHSGLLQFANARQLEFERTLSSRLQAAALTDVFDDETVDDSVVGRPHHTLAAKAYHRRAAGSPPRILRRRAGRLRLEGHGSPEAIAAPALTSRGHRQRLTMTRMVNAFHAAVDTLTGPEDAQQPAHLPRRLSEGAEVLGSDVRHTRQRAPTGSVIDLQAFAAASARVAHSQHAADAGDPVQPVLPVPSRTRHAARGDMDGGTGAFIDTGFDKHTRAGAAAMPAFNGVEVDPAADAALASKPDEVTWVSEPQPLQVFVEPEYEHLDFKWAASCRMRTYPAVLLLLQRFQHLQMPYTHTPGIPAEEEDWVRKPTPSWHASVPDKSAPQPVGRARMHEPSATSGRSVLRPLQMGTSVGAAPAEHSRGSSCLSTSRTADAVPAGTGSPVANRARTHSTEMASVASATNPRVDLAPANGSKPASNSDEAHPASMHVREGHQRAAPAAKRPGLVDPPTLAPPSDAEPAGLLEMMTRLGMLSSPVRARGTAGSAREGFAGLAAWSPQPGAVAFDDREARGADALMDA